MTPSHGGCNIYQRGTIHVCPIYGVVTAGTPHQNISWFKHIPQYMRLVSGNPFEYLVDQELNESQDSSQKKMLVSCPWVAPSYRYSFVGEHQLLGLIF